VARRGGSSTAPPSTAGTAAGTTAGTTIESRELQRLPPVPAPSGAPPSSASTSEHEFLTEVFDDVQRLWQREFASAQITYRPARLTIFRHAVGTACGTHGTDVGPFYRPASAGVYLDTVFFKALSAKAGVHLGDSRRRT
jgi:predicted metalloprotease